MGDMKDRENDTLSGDGLDEELKRIRDAFQEELDGATQKVSQEKAAEEHPQPDQEISAEPDADDPAQPADRKPDWKAIVLAAVVVLVALAGAVDFIWGVPAFARVLQAEQFVRQNQLNSAMDAYYEASQNTVAAAAKRTAKGQARLYLDLGYVENAQSMLRDFDLDKAANRDLKELSQQLDGITATISAVEGVFGAYEEVEEDQLPYDELIGKIDALKDAADQNYDKAILEYYKYMLAAMTEQESAVRIRFLEAIQKENASYGWLYLPAMATEYIEAKDYGKVIALCAQMRERNVEDAGSYGTEASVYRLQKEYDKALSTAEKGIALDDTSSEPYRQKAIVQLLQGDKKSALENAQTAYDLSLNYATSYTVALCYLANGDEDGYAEVLSTLEYYSVEMGQKVLDYKDGKLTAEDIFLSGEGDVA